MRRFHLFICAALVWALPALLSAESSPFVRILRDESGKPLSLDTSIVTLRPKEGKGEESLTVDLVSALHIGEHDYYAHLNERFKSYDAVLFELIAPPGTDFSKRHSESGTSNPVSALQVSMQKMLNLEFQLNGINYAAPNFVHADMSPQQFAKTMRDRNETFGGLFAKAFLAALKKQQAERGQVPDVQSLFLLFFDDARALALRRLLAEELDDVDGLVEALGGESGSTILTERNRVAVETLAREMQFGKRRFAIFYGGAHMPDLEDQLEKKLGLVPVASEWVVAWRLSPKRGG